MTLRDHICRALTTPCQGSYPIIFTGRGMVRRARNVEMREWVANMAPGISWGELIRRAKLGGFYAYTTTDFCLLKRLATQANLLTPEAK